VESSADIRGYFHWALTDNLEWHSSYGDRFGLIYVDFPTDERIPKDSFYWYRKVIRSEGVDPADLCNSFVFSDQIFKITIACMSNNGTHAGLFFLSAS